MTEWISVEDRLPEEDDVFFVLIHDDSDFVAIPEVSWWALDGIFTDTGKPCGAYWEIEDEYKFYKVTHWMPLPEPPKEVEQ